MQPSPEIGRQRFDIAEIVRAKRADLEARVRLSGAQRRVLSAIELCRTAALGGHVEVCCSCDLQRPAYNSCRNRHCPKCQALRQERWIAARAERLVPVPHFHAVFTLPGELRALGKCYPREIFGALFAAASETLIELGESRLHGLLGITMVLHTWTRDLRFHPHVHALVTAGVLAKDGRWLPSSTKYLFPIEVMGQLLRGKIIDALRRLEAAGAFARFDDFADPQAFEQLMRSVSRKQWIVYAKKPFRHAEHVLAYLGRYTHRIGIANSRLVQLSDDEVIFRTKNGKTVGLTPVEFLRRFVQHVLPEGFHKIRHYGLYAGAVAEARQQVIDQLAPQIPASVQSVTATASWIEQLQRLTGRDVEHCPRCGGLVERRPLIATPPARAPPQTVEIPR